jgi:23S rRNA (cytosine1962-C5)-methyltransferase
MLALLDQFSPLGDESRRLLHGRGGGFRGLEHVAIDWFAPVLLVTLYTAKERNIETIADLVEFSKSKQEIEAVVVQERYRPKAPKRIVYGKLPSQSFAAESGLNFHVELDRNQNHGFFLDMKTGRDWIRANASGRRVLNLFAYTCSLSVAAIAGGAEAVVNLDMAGGALATGRKNHHLNFEREKCERASYLAHDLFKSWGRLVRGAPYDLIVIDPPSNQGNSFTAERHYPKILRRLPELLTADSQILACLNAPHLDDSFLIRLFQDYRNHGRLPCAPGFEDLDPGAALKCLLFAPH